MKKKKSLVEGSISTTFSSTLVSKPQKGRKMDPSNCLSTLAEYQSKDRSIAKF
jgi:hypothetical protein